jgi:dTDP-4-dehydrorhamnose 3,5-epimerase-like enzyme
VACVADAVLDVVVALRVGSPAFGNWQVVRLAAIRRAAIFLAESLGHGFMALSEWASVPYLCSTPYVSDREHGMRLRDPALGALNQAACGKGNQAVCGKGYALKRRRRRWISYSWTMAVA